MTPVLALAEPPATMCRVGRRPDAWAWPDWTYAHQLVAERLAKSVYEDHARLTQMSPKPVRARTSTVSLRDCGASEPSSSESTRPKCV